ncbi:MarR family winged helix-turn-helix transcriptional regulator [Pararobbsia silviterrae]|uniref:MarR family transcriptional regulator n=1 Tax=Pararobbsia silviterrae TaxID=1792498 RepID=A0A494Y970_9BURK|nr:MarR family transcriptional regulator [Pararobbsia silviterrae]RKP58896.1 MarR family transcriptional regulator [Pararobbsia silviterrae]
MNERERIALIQQFGRTYRAFMAAFEGRVGQPLPRWRVLIALYDNGGARSQRQLVEQCRIDPGALTRQVKALEALEWVDRRTDERDNRVTNVSLTDAGRAIVETCLPQRDAFLAEAMSRIDDTTLSALSSGLALLEAGVADSIASHAVAAVADPVE